MLYNACLACLRLAFVFFFPVNNYSYSYSAEYCSELFGIRPNTEKPIFGTALLYIHFRRLSPRNGILPGAKFTLRPPILALSYIGSITARHSSSGCEPNFAAFSTRRHLYWAGRPSRWALAHILVMSYFLGHIRDAAYCYRPSSLVCASVCHSCVPYKNGWTDWDAVQVEWRLWWAQGTTY